MQTIRKSLCPGDIEDLIRHSSIASFDPATQDIGLLPEIIRNSKTSNDLDVRQKRTEERN
jgi:hypothetical protein